MHPESIPATGRRGLLLAALACAAFSTAAPAQTPPPPGSQIEQEDLGASELREVELSTPDLDLQELRLSFDHALSLFQSADQPASVPGFLRVVESLGPRATTGQLSPEELELLARALSYLAQVHFNLGDDQTAENHLRQLIEVAPAFDLDRATVSPKLAERFDRLRRQLVGLVELVVDPPDAKVTIDGTEVDALAGSVAVLAGERALEVARPGYAPYSELLSIAAGKNLNRQITLERTSPVLRIISRPAGASVWIDGVEVAQTSGSPASDFLPEGVAAVFPREEFSAELVLDGIEPGVRVVEIRKPGYRNYRGDLLIDEPLDYRLPPIVLDEERGFVVLRQLPADAVVRVDGEVVEPENRRSPMPQLALAPGDHQLTVAQGPAKMFTANLTLADRQTVEVSVRLRPGLALLGILGGDPAGAERLRGWLRTSLGGLDAWTLIDRSEVAPALLVGQGFDAPRLRRHAEPAPEGEEIDWAALQATLDQRMPGLVYVLGVLSNDLVATHADLWILPAAPGPPKPDRLRLALDEPSEIARLGSAFSHTPRLRRPWLGALLIDSQASPHPIVAHVSAGGPAEAAGLAVGDQVLAVAQVTVLRSTDLEERIAAAETGEIVQLAVRSAAGARTVEVRLGSSPVVLGSTEHELPEAVVFAELVILADKADPATAWVVELNQAMVLLRTAQWEAAVRRLRSVKVPTDERELSQAAVDYWLGLALTAAGPRYRDTAIAAFERAAAATDDRLYHRDGPWVSPRAKARLAALGAANQP